jgi:hypothetical protein
MDDLIAFSLMPVVRLTADLVEMLDTLFPLGSRQTIS